MISKPQLFRKIVRQNIKTVMDYLHMNYVLRENDKAVKPAEQLQCSFCDSSENITREHIVPRWVFAKNTTSFFTTTLNGLDQTYNKATIPACARCNSDLLNDLEKTIQQLFLARDVKADPFSVSEVQEIIRWLEMIDYKLQVYNITRKFLVSKGTGKIDHLADYPMYLLLPNKPYSPFQVISAIRKSLKRLTIAGKNSKINSLVVFKTTNQGFHFIHTINDFIFLELPQHKIALFYFYNREFSTQKEAFNNAQAILEKEY